MSKRANPRPTTKGEMSFTTTPRTTTLIQLLGGFQSGPVTLSRDEIDALNRLYGFKKEKPNARPPPPDAPVENDFPGRMEYDRAVDQYHRAYKAWERWQDPQPLYQAGADRNMLRNAETDGLRLVAWLARYVSRGEDPLKHLIQAASDAGWDVDPEDLEWAENGE